MSRNAGKVAVIAGGGGIGMATARRLVSEGAKVVLGDVDAEKTHAFVRELTHGGGHAVATAMDLAEPASIEKLFELAEREFGGVDMLHCNGALTGVHAPDGDVQTTDPATWRQVLDINLTGHFLCTKAALPLMLARGGGSIVYTSSGAAFFSDTTRVSYAVSKAGLHALMRHVALRWGKHGIRANAVAPGLVLTGAATAVTEHDREGVLARSCTTRLGQPDDIAAMVAMLLSNEAEWITGQAIGIDGGYHMR